VFQLINESFAQYARLLKDGNYVLFYATYQIIIEFIKPYPEIAMALIRYAYGLSQVVFQPYHPFRVLLNMLRCMDSAEILNNWEPLLNLYTAGLIKGCHDDTVLLYEIQVCRVKAASPDMRQRFVEWESSEAAIERDISRLHKYSGPSDLESLVLKLALTQRLWCRGEAKRCRAIVAGVQRTAGQHLQPVLVEPLANIESLTPASPRLHGRHNETTPRPRQSLEQIGHRPSEQRIVGFVAGVLETAFEGLRQKMEYLNLHESQEDVANL
jgi:hypothetical protein